MRWWKFQPQWASASRFKTSGRNACWVSHKETERKVMQTLSPGWKISQIVQSLFIGNHLLLLEAMSRALWWGWIIPPTIPICQSQMITRLLRAPAPGALSYSERPHLYFVHQSHCALSHISDSQSGKPTGPPYFLCNLLSFLWPP